MKHPIKIESFESLEDLAKAIGNMRYDKLAEFVEKLSDDLEKQAEADRKKDRIKLSNELYAAALRLRPVYDRIYEAWRISEPYMRDTEQETQ